jgi:hypothetical protein
MPMFEPGSCSELGSDEFVEEVKAMMKTQNGPETSNANAHTTTTTRPSLEALDYLDLSEFAPPSPDFETDEEHFLSLSHPGTLGKRKRTTSPAEETAVRKRGRQEREPTPNLDSFVFILQRERRVNNGDIKPLIICDADYVPDNVDDLPDYVSPQASPLHQLPPKPAPVTSDNCLIQKACPAMSSAPTGPRALLGGAPVCFYWYHKGHCTPGHKNGRTKDCTYAHNLDNPNAKVSLPPRITNHNPKCSLPLCPVKNVGHDSSTPPDIKAEPRTSPEIDTARDFSSSPRSGITEARSLLRGPKFDGNPKFQQLPKLTGASRQRFKLQTQAVEKWQIDNGITASNPMRTTEEKAAARRLNKQLRKQKKWEKRQANVSTIKYEDRTVSPVVSNVQLRIVQMCRY